MIDPVQIAAANRFSSDSIDNANRIKKNQTTGESSESDPRLKLEQKPAKDAVALNFNLKGDLEALQGSVETIFGRVKAQLEKYFSITGQEPEAGENKFLPPEDASAKEIMDFFSPKNTAGRIVDFATGFFNTFAKNHSDESEEEQVEEFSTLITNAVKKGFSEAKGILGDLSEHEEVSQNIEETYQLVLQGIEEYRVEYLRRQDIPAVDPEAQPDPLEQMLEQKQETTTQTEPDPEPESETVRPDVEFDNFS